MGMNMDIRRRFEFLPGEKVYHEIRRIRYCSSLSSPSYRIAFPVPVLLRMSLHITDRRVVFLAWSCGFIIQEYSSWYPACAPEGDTELVDSVRVGGRPWLGPYLEIVSRNDHRRGWYRYLMSATVRIRYHIKNPETYRDTIRKFL